MTDVTNDQREKLTTLVSEAMQAEEAPAARESLAGVDPRELFCQNWDTVRSVLIYIRDHFPVPIPGIVKTAISVLIRIGDGAHAILCGG